MRSFLSSILGGIIANEKGKGYGKQVVVAIREYLIACDTTGLGFCFPKNQGFYEKCGLKVDTHSTQRFVYRNGQESALIDMARWRNVQALCSQRDCLLPLPF